MEQIVAGFGHSVVALRESRKKGQFSYRIDLDGKTVTFSVPNVNETIGRYTYDTYLELEEFDQALVKLGIPKVSSEEGWEDCDLDQRYVDRFFRIIPNQSE